MIAKLEEKKRKEKDLTDTSSALTTVDIGHDMLPTDDDMVNAAPDKDDAAAYAAVKETDTSV